MPVNAGDFTARITIERDTATSVAGAELRGTSTPYTLWVKPEALGGRESFRDQQIAAGADWRFTAGYEYRGKILTSDRVIYGDLRMEIVTVAPDDLNRDAVILLCKNINA
jgi:SPP1 family predicted phage head-tail adaptor